MSFKRTSLGEFKRRRECAMNNHSDDLQLREKWERRTRTPTDVIRNERTGVTHLAVSHQDYTLCGISGLRRIRRHGLLNLIKQVPMENAALEATCHICKRHSLRTPLTRHYAQHPGHSRDAVIDVYDAAGKAIDSAPQHRG